MERRNPERKIYVTLKEYIDENIEFENPQFLIRKPLGYDEITGYIN